MNEDTGGFIGVLCAILSWFFGGIDGTLKVLMTFMVIDYTLGLIGAIINHSVSADEGFKWTTRKFIILLIVGVAHLIGTEILKDSIPLRDFVICFYIASEGMSIVENADRVKVPIPKALKNVFEKLRDKEEENEGSLESKKLKGSRRLTNEKTA